MNYRRVTRLITAVLIMACLVGISGCKRTYDLAIGVEGMGTVSPTPGIHQYERDLPVTLKAVPAQGWGFTGWGGPHGKTVIDNSTIMDRNKYITAIFQKLQHQLDISVEPAGAGTVEVAIVPVSKAAPIADGQTVRLIAVPNDGYVFGCWDDDPENSSVTLEFLMDAPKTIKAAFIAVVAAPEFTPAQGTYNYAQEVALTCATPGAEIRYTTDGITVPTATEGTPYKGTPIQVTKTTVIKAIAYKSGMTDSAVVTRVYTIDRLQFPLNITIEPADAGTVEVAIVPASKAAPIADGQTVRLTAVPKTGYAFGCWNDDPESNSATLEFLMDAPKTVKATFIAVVAAPEFTPAQGTYNYGQEVALTCATPGAEIRYTTDGITVPSATEGTLYSAQLQLTQSAVIKAIAYKPGLVDSAVVTKVYTIKAPTPVADLVDGDYFGSQAVTLSTTPANMTIRYTLDGSVPTATHGIIFHGPITIDKTMTLQAVAYAANLAVSNVLTRNYSIYSLSTRAPMPTPRKGLAAAAIGGKVYAIGGMNSTGILGTVEAYDPVTNTWETKASMPTARTCLAAAVMDGYIYTFGGRTDSAYSTQTVERYNPQTNTWESRADAPRSLASCTAVPNNGVIHIVGGGYSSPGSEFFFNGHFYYYPQADAWQEAPSPPRSDDNEHFRGNSAAAVDRTIYYFGGAYATVWPSEYTRLYNTLWQSWSYGTNVPVKCQDAAAAAIGNRVFLIGGFYFNDWSKIVNQYDAIRLYNPETNSWVSTFATMPTARYLHAAAVIGESIYIVGGELADGVLAADVIEFGLKR